MTYYGNEITYNISSGVLLDFYLPLLFLDIVDLTFYNKFKLGKMLVFTIQNMLATRQLLIVSCKQTRSTNFNRFIINIAKA